MCGRCCNLRNLLRLVPWKIKIIFFILKPKSFYLWATNKSCDNLIKIGNKSICFIYNKRPWFCKAYPSIPEDIIYRCGYHFKWRDK
jgi:hypothetical protein